MLLYIPTETLCADEYHEKDVFSMSSYAAQVLVV